MWGGGRHGSLAVKSWGVVGITVFWDPSAAFISNKHTSDDGSGDGTRRDSVAPAPPILKDTEVHSITHLHAGWGFQVLLERMASLGI